jgi:hypothetical protein
MQTIASRISHTSPRAAWRQNARLSDVLAALTFAAAIAFSAAVVFGLIG